MRRGSGGSDINAIDIGWVLVLTALFEAVTCAFRWGLNLQSTRDTAFLAPFTLRLRIHHGYVGALGSAAVFFAPWEGPLAAWALRAALALLVSDLVHHFVVLKISTGNPEFDLVYPPPLPVSAEAPDDVE